MDVKSKKRIIDSKEELLLTKIGKDNTDLRYGGYKRNILLHNLSVLEENFLICARCRGIMYNACSIDVGRIQLCESCVVIDEEPHPVGPARTTIDQINCKCPLEDRGCDWKGTVGDIFDHLDDCSQFVFECPYVKYGCKKILNKSELEVHRAENKDYHTELMSIFMVERIEKLEFEKQEQATSIKLLQEELHKKNKITWEIDKNQIYSKLRQLGLPIEGANIAFNRFWGGNVLYSGGHYVYGIYPVQFHLNFNVTNVTLSIVLIGGSPAANGSYILPFNANIRITLMSMENSENSIHYELKDLSLGNGATLAIATIPSLTLIEKQFSNENYITFRMEIEQL